jgi:hypothetical protein
METSGTPGNLEQRFTEVYRKGLWGPQKSGPGSTVDATRSLRNEISSLMGGLFPPGSTVALIDAACGDMAWMPLLLGELAVERGYVLRYVGVEIVKDLVEKNVETCRSAERIQYSFLHRDLTKSPPPRGDLILCKDLVNHLVFDDIWSLLDGFNRSGSRFLLITSNEGHCNLDIEKMEGNASRHLNLEAAPFFLPRPLWSNGYLSFWPLPLDLGERTGGEDR